MAKETTPLVRIYFAESGQSQDVQKVIKTDTEWKKVLTAEQFRILRGKGTERPGTGMCAVPKQGGLYRCAGCGTDLFGVNEKFESGTGWPSFWQPVSDSNIRLGSDRSVGMERTEVSCARCDGHLGHVFEDGPPPTGKRYCINSAALIFVPLQAARPEKAAFAAGCFWGIEAALAKVPGVVSTAVGYMGGILKDPTYEQVCSDTTGHAECVEIEFDTKLTSYEKLLDFFWRMHDPTQVSRQGPDVGTQYRSVIFFYSLAQEKAARLSREGLTKSGKFKKPIATEIVAAGHFYRAEEYHQKYFQKRGVEPTCHF